MTDLTEALREAGHGDIADALEKKALAGQLRKAGRDDLADALEAGGEPEPEPEQPQPGTSAKFCSMASPRPRIPGTPTAGTRRTRLEAGMPRRVSAHQELDALRQQAAAEGVKRRELEAQLGAARAEVEGASARITDGYAAEDEQAVAAGRKAEEAAVAKVKELAHRLAGAEIRAERAEQTLAAFQTERARDLLNEMAPEAERIATDLNDTLERAVRLDREWQTHRQATDELVNRVGRSRYDSPDSAHPFTSPLASIRSTLAAGGVVAPHVPHWRGDRDQQAEQRARRLLQLRRIRKRTSQQERELQALSSGSPAVAIADDN